MNAANVIYALTLLVDVNEVQAKPKPKDVIESHKFIWCPRDVSHAYSIAVEELVRLGLQSKYDIQRPQNLPSIQGPPSSAPGSEYLIAFPLIGATVSKNGRLICHCLVRISYGDPTITQFPTQDRSFIRVFLEGKKVLGYEVR